MTPTARRRAARRTLLLGCALGVLFVGALAACGDDGGAAAPTADDLDGRAFVATSTDGHTIVAGSEIRISFDDGIVFADPGCNTLRGGYTVSDGVLEVGEMAGTLAACEEPLMDQDAWVNDLLTSGPAIELAGDELVISSDAGAITLDADG